MPNSSRDKNGTHGSGEGRGRGACYVTPDLRYERQGAEESTENIFKCDREQKNAHLQHACTTPLRATASSPLPSSLT